MKIVKPSNKFLIVIAGLLIFVLLIRSFNSRMADLRRLETMLDQVGATATTLVETYTSQKTQIAWATSDAAVAQWAYDKAHMARKGDIIVVPQAGGGSTPTPAPRPLATPEVWSNWQYWLSLFVDVKIP